MSTYSCCNRRNVGGKTVIAMYTCKDNLTPLLYSGKKKRQKKKKRNAKIHYLLKLHLTKSNTLEYTWPRRERTYMPRTVKL